MLQPLSSLPESELALQKCCVQVGFGICKPALSCPHLLLQRPINTQDIHGPTKHLPTTAGVFLSDLLHLPIQSIPKRLPKFVSQQCGAARPDETGTSAVLWRVCMMFANL